MSGLTAFVKESNRIEGILREPTRAEIEAHQEFLAESSGCLEVASLERFVAVVAPGKLLRKKRGMDVRVGSHIAPRGGPEIVDELCNILTSAVEGYDPIRSTANTKHFTHSWMAMGARVAFCGSGE